MLALAIAGLVCVPFLHLSDRAAEKLYLMSKGGSVTAIWWWERRRLRYNFIVAATGVGTIILVGICSLVAESLVGEPIGIPDPPAFVVIGVIFYSILANVFYTGGWMVDLLVAPWKDEDFRSKFRSLAFRSGLRLSIGITLLPAVICWVYFVVLLGMRTVL